MNAWNALCKKRWHYRIHEAANYNQKALALANQLGYKKGQAEAYRCSGVILLSRQNHSNYSLSHLQYALKIFKELEDERGQAITLSNLSTYYSRRDQIKKAKNALLTARQLFEKLNDRAGIGEVAHQSGEMYYQARDYPSALQQYRQALDIRRQIGDSEGTASTLVRIGYLYAIGNQRHMALTNYLNAYRIGYANRYSQVIADATWGMASIYERQEKYAEALVYYEQCAKAQKAFQANVNPWLYQSIAGLYKRQNKYGEALAHYQLSLNARTGTSAGVNSWEVAQVHQQIAELYTVQRKYDVSLAHLHEALAIIDPDKPRSVHSLATPILNQLGRVYLAQGNYANALKNATRSLQLARKLQIRRDVQEASLTISLIYAALRNYPKAYEHLRQYTSLRDTLFNQEITNLAALKNGLEMNQKQDQVNLLWKENQEQASELDESTQRNYALLAGVLLFFTLVIVLIRNNQRNQRTNRLVAEQAKQLEEQRIRELEQTFEYQQAETKMATLRAQMNPHFIFNCLNSIKFYATDNEAAKASQYLTKFSRLIRLVLENSRSERVMLSQELEALQLYLEMEAMRFKDKLSFHIEVADQIDREFVEIPPLLIQPYVENAIWHGLMHKLEGGTVRVTVSQPQEAVLEVRINDDGVGRAKAAEFRSKSANRGKSFGTKVTGERIALINQVYRIQTEVQIRDLTNEQGLPAGTEVTLQIPI